MQALQDGMNVDPNIQIQVLSNKLAQACIREAQLESGIQQLIGETQRLQLTIDAMVDVQGEADANPE